MAADQLRPMAPASPFGCRGDERTPQGAMGHLGTGAVAQLGGSQW